ncbi:tRNA pseudouridine38-40 synthase [Singulisphaera sp. GP187]|uniref:tRNA pseudouridine(38-40) synthase TruA n=1 Tax=Singulisphaera sp. GP187 TaxID=1882752 RepID=UPI00092C237E|nr:tRNA pseudouridine(38-40) synthase TruA [Singulisphaera sp. GP187]SIO59428.1 tRNA pseudouridine38-40 synthase [Singulisphaera sp. GP187]
MRNIKLLLSYDGTDFSGWQRQPDRRTVQQTLEEAIQRLTGAAAVTNASGRTDAGVHAIGQVAHFYTVSRHAPEVFVKALNATLPHDIRIRNAWDMPQAFHSTLDAKSKRYRYVIDNGRIADPFQTRYSYHVYQPIDVAAMHRAAQALKGRHDFHSFETQWPNRTSSVRTIFDIAVTRKQNSVWVEVEADGFLYNMVRSITGTLLLVGTGRWAESRVREALVAEDRREAGPTAPPQGLFMLVVRYGHADEVDPVPSR